ncbi:hypothetical protein C7B61_09390 [filamentous cyanobacterium CCP1]|nr:hypothetical protein C7B61_09390 [filamentous cyanobacterium CCP1]
MRSVPFNFNSQIIGKFFTLGADRGSISMPLNHAPESFNAQPMPQLTSMLQESISASPAVVWQDQVACSKTPMPQPF